VVSVGLVSGAPDVFVSYTQADRPWAEWIAWVLEEAGFSTVLQAWDFAAGENFVARMQQASAEAKRTIAVLSPDYARSRWGEWEWTAVLGQQRLLPVRVRDFDPAGLLRVASYVDLVGIDEQAARKRLLTAIERAGSRAKPAVGPAFPGGELARAAAPRFPGALPEIRNVPAIQRPEKGGDSKGVENATVRAAYVGAAAVIVAALVGAAAVVAGRSSPDASPSAQAPISARQATPSAFAKTSSPECARQVHAVPANATAIVAGRSAYRGVQFTQPTPFATLAGRVPIDLIVQLPAYSVWLGLQQVNSRCVHLASGTPLTARTGHVGKAKNGTDYWAGSAGFVQSGADNGKYYLIAIAVDRSGDRLLRQLIQHQTWITSLPPGLLGWNYGTYTITPMQALRPLQLQLSSPRRPWAVRATRREGQIRVRFRVASREAAVMVLRSRWGASVAERDVRVHGAGAHAVTLGGARRARYVIVVALGGDGGMSDPVQVRVR
jgi:hypothetical protein